MILHSPEPISGLTTVWIIGSPVLKGYYTVWDGRNLELGVGTLKEHDSNPSETRSPASTPASGAGVLTPHWRLFTALAGLLFVWSRQLFFIPPRTIDPFPFSAYLSLKGRARLSFGAYLHILL